MLRAGGGNTLPKMSHAERGQSGFCCLSLPQSVRVILRPVGNTCKHGWLIVPSPFHRILSRCFYNGKVCMSNQGFFVWCSNRTLEHNQQLPSEIPPENQYEVCSWFTWSPWQCISMNHPGEGYLWPSCPGLKLSRSGYDLKTKPSQL